VSVITCIHDDYYHCDDKSRKCTVCSRQLSYPFICWDELGGALYICGPCCRRTKRGLMADIVHLSAIVELRAIDTSYHGHTLERTTLTALKDQALTQLAREHALMSEMSRLRRD
jgi:hypothetical protein